MSIIKQEYGLTEKRNAMFVAYLMDSAIYENNGKISFVDKENLNNCINKLISEKKFIESKQLIKAARDVTNYELITAEVCSKSYRVPFIAFAKLLTIPTNNESIESISDNIKMVILPILRSTADDLNKAPNINLNKLNLINTLISDWSKKASVKRDTHYNTFFEVSFDTFEADELAKELITKYLQIILHLKCSEHGLDPSIVEKFIEAHSTSMSELHYSPFIKYINFNLNPSNGKLSFTIRADFSYGIDDKTGTTVTDDFCIEAKKIYGDEQATKFNEILVSICDTDDIELGEYEATLSNGELFINGTSLNDEESLKKTIYEKLAKEYHCYEGAGFPIIGRAAIEHKLANKLGNKEDSIKISYISLLPSDFDEILYTKELEDAISNNDYQKALEYNETLEIHEVLDKLSATICTIFKLITRESKVVTIIIPNTLLGLLDLARGARSNQQLISEAIENYWLKTKTQGGIE
jgi:hypothetical protein